jgi:hypothetical protein
MNGPFMKLPAICLCTFRLNVLPVIGEISRVNEVSSSWSSNLFMLWCCFRNLHWILCIHIWFATGSMIQHSLCIGPNWSLLGHTHWSLTQNPNDTPGIRMINPLQ